MNFREMSKSVALSSVEWCSQNIFLSTRIPTSEPGQWKRNNALALCLPGGPLESLDDPSIETVVIEKGAQTTLTTTAYCWLAHRQVVDPSSALIVMNSTQDARDKSAETWRPMWEDSPKLQKYMPVSHRKDWTKLYQLINRSPVYWTGANSPGRLGAKPIRRLVLDEVDKYPQQSKRETGAAALARQRVKTFKKKGLAKVLEFSTPTREDAEIHLEYLNGDQRQLTVKCQHCQGEQVMLWRHFKIDMEGAKTEPGVAVRNCMYKCPLCGAMWTDEQRWAAIASGRWVATVKARDPKCVSYRLPSWLSTFVTNSYLAAQWLRAQTSASSLQDFINSECAEPFIHYENSIRDERFAQLEGSYKEGEIWCKAESYIKEYGDSEVFVLGGVDVQKGYLVAVFRAFRAGGDSGLIWAGEVSNFATLDTLAAKYDAKYILIDSRYRTQEVNEWCAANSGYIPAQGATRKSTTIFTVNEINIDEGKRGSHAGRIIQTVTHQPDAVKDILAELIQGKTDACKWMIPQGYAAQADYCKQMTAEKNINGKWIPVPAQRPNHFWDAECLALLAAIRFQVWRSSYGTADQQPEK